MALHTYCTLSHMYGPATGEVLIDQLTFKDSTNERHTSAMLYRDILSLRPASTSSARITFRATVIPTKPSFYNAPFTASSVGIPNAHNKILELLSTLLVSQFRSPWPSIQSTSPYYRLNTGGLFQSQLSSLTHNIYIAPTSDLSLCCY